MSNGWPVQWMKEGAIEEGIESKGIFKGKLVMI
jgi:hypothetical protein